MIRSSLLRTHSQRHNGYSQKPKVRLMHGGIPPSKLGCEPDYKDWQAPYELRETSVKNSDDAHGDENHIYFTKTPG